MVNIRYEFASWFNVPFLVYSLVKRLTLHLVKVLLSVFSNLIYDVMRDDEV